ncbi:hypothetical protein HA402_012839 [Bradysia odoriphaga]|nr:hypothetical protein HA402_012839 [Bradysia odoriphaga]
MTKLLIIVAAMAAIAFAAPTEKRKSSLQTLFGKERPSYHLPTTSIPTNVTLLTVTQRVDNFNPANTNTWQQRYLMNNEFYRPRSPIFLYLAGASAIDDVLLTSSHMRDIARDLHAGILQLEHRFYGQSHPTANVNILNLRFLSVEQALADTAHFINHIRRTVQGAADSQFILVGGHYSASLAVWFRQQYPHLALGVWASSAPLHSVVDFVQHKIAVGAAYRRVGGDACYYALEVGFNATQDMIDAGQWTEVSQYFNLCRDLDPVNVPHFFSTLAAIYGRLPSTATEASIRATCALLQGPGHPVQNTAAVLSFFFDPDECFNIDYEELIESERETEWNATSVVSGGRQWSYQLCGTIGWVPSSGSPDQPFGSTFPAEFFLEGCQVIFDDLYATSEFVKWIAEKT